MTSFLNKQNIELLWDVLLDELNVNKSNTVLIQNIKLVFDKNIGLFSSKLNPKISIMVANKHFLSQMVIAINKLFPKEQPKLIKISDEEVLEPYKIEDIQTARKQEFESQYELRKNDFDSFMNTPKPKEINLSYNISEEKITSMDSLVADKMAERERDILISPDPNAQKWLQSFETSVKPQQQDNNINKNTNSGQRLKHIQIDNTNNISLNISEKPKKVTWNDENETNLSVTNIFSKLKTLDKTEDKYEYKDEYKDKDKITIQYEEQKSVNLLDIGINTFAPVAQPSTNTNAIINNPIISNSQIIKQINELTNKINETDEKLNKILDIVSLLVKQSQNLEEIN